MPYAAADLSKVAPLNKGRAMWVYISRDTLSTIMSADYFNLAARRLIPGDPILIYGYDGQLTARVSIVTAAGAVTVVAHALDDQVSVTALGAKGDGTTDDTAAFVAALDRSDLIFVPRAAASYVVGDLPIPSGSVLIGESMPIYSAYNSATYTAGHSTLKLKSGATNLILPAINTSFQNLMFEGVDAASNMLGKNAGAQVQRIRFIQCGMHRFLRAVYQASYVKEAYIQGCMISACGTGIRDCIDSIVTGCYIHANTGDGVQLNSGANDNQFIGNKIEFNGEDNFQCSSNSVRNIILGGIIDHAQEHGIAITDADIQINSVHLRRNGRAGGSNYALYINGARRVVVTNVTSDIGKEDDGSGTDSPVTAVRLQGANGKIIITDSDFSTSTTPLSIDAAATFDHLRIDNVVGLDDRALGSGLDYSPYDGIHSDYDSVTVAAGQTGTVTLTRPVVADSTAHRGWLDVIARQTSGGTGYATISFPFVIGRAAGSPTLTWGAGVQVGSEFGAAVPGVSGNSRVSVSNVLSTGGGFDVSVENTTGNGWRYRCIVRPH